MPCIHAYASHLSVRAGEHVSFHVSTDAPAYGYDVVRLSHRGVTPVSGFAAPAGRLPGRTHRSFPGSYLRADGRLGFASWTMRCFVYPTRPATGSAQGIMALGDGARLGLDGAGRVVLAIDGATEPLQSATAVRARTWVYVAATYDARANELGLFVVEIPSPGRLMKPVTCACRAVAVPVDGPLLVGAVAERRNGGGVDTLDGKVACPRIDPEALSVERLCDAALERFRDVLGVAWSLVDASPDGQVPDVGPHGVHGRLVNRPAPGVTGPHWTGHELDPRRAPTQYDAAHFHTDDLDDARWPVAFGWQVPDALPSGVYAARIRAGEAEDHVPVVVSGRRAAARVCVVLPTFTYLAYGNNVNDPCDASTSAHDVRPLPDAFGFSLYEPHADGSERCYASLRRPLLDLRPWHRYPGLEAPVHLPGDLDLLDWLDQLGIAYDVLTDHVLHIDGLAALDGYDVALTGSHPEYASGAVLDAVEDYVAGGGRLMYLGGNGYYWVTAPVGENLHAIEVRRGHSGTRPWRSEAGETHLAATGEPGGLWRHRGRPPNRLVGVGFAAHGCDGVARGYRRTPASHAPELDFVFRGVTETEAIGATGPGATGAAGIEVDRGDARCGTPADTIVLATARVRSDRYHVAIEDLDAIGRDTSGIDNENVRADMTLRVLPNGGAVFSVGSIAWSSCLPHNGFDNDVARVTQNVLDAFVAAHRP